MSFEVKMDITNEERFINAIRRAKAVTDDLRVPFTLIAKDFFKSQKPIFMLKSKGQYEDLNSKYKKRKQREVGFVYPILKKSGLLEKSLTNPKDPNAVSEIINKDTLLLGTKVFYGRFHQLGEGVPMRPFLFIGPEASRYATSEQQGRPERWLNIMNAYVLSRLGEELESNG